MRHTFALALLFAAASHAQDIAGDWQGVLNAGPTQLHLTIHIRANSGNFSGTMDSADQGALGIPLSGIAFEESTLNFRVDSIRGSYKGKLSGEEISGNWTQGMSLPLNFKRGVAPATVKHPQEPSKPYPYISEELTYENHQAGITLAGTLTLPEGEGPFPGVVLITGSGPQDRDESIMGHKPFLVLSDYLTRHGIAVLRSDDRGVGKSGGKFDTATTADFATDAEAALARIKTRPEVNRQKLGLIGHSEGGEIAAMIGARNKDAAFIVALAGPAVAGDKIVPAQVIAGNLALGMRREMAVENGDREAQILKLVENEKDAAKLRLKLAELLPASQVDGALANLTSPWYRYFLEYDPGLDWKKVKIPVLALYGSKDMQVPANLNIPALKKALAANKSVTIEEMQGLNHLFQHAKTGLPAEYSGIQETISDDILRKVSDWVLER